MQMFWKTIPDDQSCSMETSSAKFRCSQHGQVTMLHGVEHGDRHWHEQKDPPQISMFQLNLGYPDSHWIFFLQLFSNKTFGIRTVFINQIDALPAFEPTVSKQRTAIN